MLESITVEGFKSIASIQDLKLGPINVLIGPNGSGKSNFIGVFSFLHAIYSGRLQEYVMRAGGAERVLHFGSKITEKLAIHVFFEDRVVQYGIKLAATDTDTLYPSAEFVDDPDLSKDGHSHVESLWSRGGEAAISSPHGKGIVLGSGPPLGIGTLGGGISESEQYVRDQLSSWRLYHFHDTSSTSPMRKTVDVNDNRYLRTDASNLAAFLYFLRVKHETEFNLIRRTVQLVAPYFDDFLLLPLALNEDKIRLEWRHKGTDAYFDASSFSDGTLRFISLATLLLQPVSHRPSVILIDEPELGLHPKAITLFASLVKQASVSTQVILATQSPILLDHFQPEDVLVVDREKGQTQFRQLDADSLEVWLRDYSLGQLWEKNEIGGRPATE